MVRTTGARSRHYQLNVITVPKLENVSVRVTLPAYTHRPPYEGPINSNPDNGMPYTVTIPFLGVKGPSAATGDGAALKAAASNNLSVASSVKD